MVDILMGQTEVWRHNRDGGMFFPVNTPGPVKDFGPERGSAKGTIADLGPLGS